MPMTWPEYRKENALNCVGPFGGTVEIRQLTLGGKRYEQDGAHLRVLAADKDKDDEVRIGVLSSVKDFTDETHKNLDRFFAWFAEEKIEFVVLNGDIAGDEEELEELLAYLVTFNTPLLISIGNYESRGSYFRAVSAAADKSPLIVDMNLVRIIEADDITLVSVPGYFDRRFLHSGSGCLYRPSDIDATLEASEKLPGPKLLISHGPPKGRGARAIDVISDGHANAGDPALTRLLRDGGFDFGIFGHLLESGARAEAGDFSMPIAADTWAPKLYVNAGAASALPWPLNDGGVATGMAAVMVVAGHKAKVKFKVFKEGHE